MEKVKFEKVTKKLIKKKYNEGKLFLFEKYLTGLPTDWFDCVSFIMFNGANENISENHFLLVLDEKPTMRLMDFVSKKIIEIIIVKKDEKENFWWNLAISPHKVDGIEDHVVLFQGGDSLRKFCDDKNLYYGSVMHEDGNLVSLTTLQYLKHAGEDCAAPLKDYSKK